MAKNTYKSLSGKYFTGLVQAEFSSHDDIVNKDGEPRVRCYFKVGRETLILPSRPEISWYTNLGKLYRAVYGVMPGDGEEVDITDMYGAKVMLDVDSSKVENGKRYNNIKGIYMIESENNE